jgi:transcription termination factor Rho
LSAPAFLPALETFVTDIPKPEVRTETRTQAYGSSTDRPVHEGPRMVSGVLEIMDKGYGFLRNPERDLRRSDADPFVGADIVRSLRLKPGLQLRGPMRRGDRGGVQLASVESIFGKPPSKWSSIKPFDELTSVDPTKRLKLETTPDVASTRIIDLLTPIGRGQRGLIVAPPRSGKTILLQQMARGIHANHPDVHITILLIDERPEEVTDMKRNVPGEVLASSNDNEIEDHVRLARLAIDRAKRMTEFGIDVVMLLDSLTRVARSFNKHVGTSGRTMTGGVDIKAMEEPKRMFGAARATEEAGSLTIMATCLIETGSRMDDLIFEEFKGTGNMEIILDRKLANNRVWPAINIQASGTRKEEKLLGPQVTQQVGLIRRSLSGAKLEEAVTSFIKTIGRYPSNNEFLAVVPKLMGDR